MKYLVPTDFSDKSQNATYFAIDLAKLTKAEVVLMHMMSIPVSWIDIPEQQRSNKYPEVTQKVEEANERLNEFVTIAEREGVKVSTYLHYNKNRSFITEFANELQAQIIVMGSHGTDEMSDFIIGTFTQRVVRFSKIPVLVVKDRIQSLQNIGLVSDFSDEALQTRDQVVSILKATQSKLHLIYINTPLNFSNNRVIVKRMLKYEKDLEIPVRRHIYNDFQFETAVKHSCEDFDIDLLIMNTHSRKGLDRLIVGSLTENVISHLNQPVLCMPLTHES